MGLGWGTAVFLAGGCGGGGSALHPLPNGNYQLAEQSVYFEVAPAGARVVDVHLPGGVNLLTGPSTDAVNFGSTFWTSPQSLWIWPPPDSFDTAAFTVSGSDASLAFTGPVDADFGMQIAKRFAAGASTATVRAEYRITSVTGDGMFAPWEITRVGPGGLTFYPTGTDAPRAGGAFKLPPTQTAAGCTWYQHPGTAPGTDQKLLADGSGGWLAHVAGDAVLVKKFADVPAGMAAPGEAEIEIFVDGQGRYVEVEQQGAYQSLPAGQTLTWPVTWIVRTLPAGLDATAGSADLVAFVQTLVSAP
ncbi:MAG: DUF4380 domain-containing protein [Pseudomonadota bacterium]